MQLKPFKEMVALTGAKLDAALAPARAMQVKSQANLKMAELDEKVITLETEVMELCTGKKIDFDKLLKKLDEIDLTERRKKQYTQVLKELFPKSK